MTHSSSTFAFEQGARLGDVFSATEVLLDDLEARGELRSGEHVARLRSRIMQIARARGALWVQQPRAAACDLFAHVLTIPELAVTRSRWGAELDARGPWLRPLRVSELDPVVLAERRLDTGLGPLSGLCFEREDAVAFEQRDTRGVQVWAWPHARIEQQPMHDSLPPLYSHDPRFPHSDAGVLYQPTPHDEPRPLPFPDFGSASAKMSSDGRSIFVYGWYEEMLGLVLVVEPSTLQVTRSHEFPQSESVNSVVDRPGSDELLIATLGELAIVSPHGTRWRRAESSTHVAWSPTGRYVCVLNSEVVRVLDTHERDGATERALGLPISFSPDGTRLVDGKALLNGSDGAPVGTLDITFGFYLEGGPAMPWYHVGTELIVSIHGGVSLWDAKTGARLPATGQLHASHSFQIAYAHSGRYFALNRRGDVLVAELPTLDTLGTLGFDVAIDRMALSSNAEFVAAYGCGVLEVRTRSGALVCRAETPTPRESSRHHPGKMWFGPDDRTVHIFEPETSSWSDDDEHQQWPSLIGTWTLVGAGARWSDAYDPSLPPGWRVTTGPFSHFHHEGGAEMVVTAQGPWIVSPVNPRLLACPGGLFEIRGRAT